jgi:hypothetical protein
MPDYINKKVHFAQTKLSVKINKKIGNNDIYKIYLCSDLQNISVNYMMKVAQARVDDKVQCNLINTEIYLLVNSYKLI